MKITDKQRTNQQDNQQEQQSEKIIAYKKLVDAACAKRDELLAKNKGVQDAITRMENELREIRARNEHETDLETALELADKGSELERKIAYAKKIKSTNVLEALKAFCDSKENRMIRIEAHDEYDVFMEAIHQHRRDAEEEFRRRLNLLDQHPFRVIDDFMDNLLSYGGWSIAGWTPEARDEANRRAEERSKQGH